MNSPRKRPRAAHDHGHGLKKDNRGQDQPTDKGGCATGFDLGPDRGRKGATGRGRFAASIARSASRRRMIDNRVNFTGDTTTPHNRQMLTVLDGLAEFQQD
jgi:hypothetical protein